MAEHPKIRLLLVDDHRMVRTGLATVIAGFDDLELIGQGSNGLEAVQLCQQHEPDVVLMDLIMPEMDGITAIRHIHERFPHICILALTSFKDEQLVRTALDYGAMGYLLKDATVDELVQAIRDAAAGKPTLSWEAAKVLISSTRSTARMEYDLTSRELEILALVVDGMTNRQIGATLDISPNTVNNHIGNILSKLGVSSRTEAATLALKENLVH